MFKFIPGSLNPFANHGDLSSGKGAVAFIVNNLAPMKATIGLCVLTTILGALIEVWLVYYAGRLIDKLISIPREALWSTLGLELLAVAFVLLLLRPVIAFANEAMDDMVFRPTAVSLIRWRAYKHVMRQSVGWFRNQQSGQLASRVREVGTSATSVAYAFIHTLTYVLTYFICSVVLLASVDPRLAVPLLVWAAIYGLHMGYAVPRFRDNYERFEEAKTDLTSHLVDTFGNIETVKLFAGKSADEPDGRSRFEAAFTSFIGVQRFEVLINVGMVVLSNLLLVGLVGYAITLWQSGEALLGMVAAALALSTRVSGMAEWLLDGVSEIYGNIGATREALKSVSEPIDMVEAKDAPYLTMRGGAIRFCNIQHRYGRTVGGLDGLSLDIAAGEKIALVGPSGAGKSTIVNLLMRHFDPESGSVLIDDQNIAGVRQSSLRGVMASVAQDASLLNRSIGENITFGLRDVSMQDLNTATRRAHAFEFIHAIEDRHGNKGYDALVGERGVKLSGGQRQRISLARALLRDAPILILDEATSALDSEVEADIQDVLYTFMSGKTVIAIAHRLSTIAHMDRIAVIDKGRVTEIGTHAELLAQKGTYARFWAKQSKGAIGIG